MPFAAHSATDCSRPTSKQRAPCGTDIPAGDICQDVPGRAIRAPQRERTAQTTDPLAPDEHLLASHLANPFAPQAGQGTKLKEARRYFLWVTQLGGFSLRSAALRLFKVESDINGILPARRRAPAIYFVSRLEQASLRALEGNCILRSTTLGSLLAATCRT